MLELVEVSSFLTKQLNTYAKNVTPSYEFDIRAEVGKYENNSVVYGLLRSNKPILSPVAGVNNIKYSLSVKLQIVSPLVNFNLKNIEKIIGEFVENWNGKEIEFSNGKGLLNLTLTSTNGFKTESGQGNIVPIEFDVNINYTENVVTSGAKHWLLNNIEIPFLSENLIVEKNGITNPISGENYKKTLLTDQLKLYRFRFNYDTSNELCSMLQRDLLEGSANKTYELKYYDGYSFTKDEPFKTTVSVYRTGDAGSVKPDTSIFDITFTDVDGANVNRETKYEMALIDFPFDEQGENTPYFVDEAEQVEYFEEMIGNGAEFVEIKAPNLNSIDLTEQVYRNLKPYDLFDLVNKNYAIIKAAKSDGSKYYFYYWVRTSQIGAENQVMYNLHLDSVQTYYFRDEINIQGSYVQKAHLDRWIETYEPYNTGVLNKPSLQEALELSLYGIFNGDFLPDGISPDLVGQYIKITKENYDAFDILYEKVLRFNFNKDGKLFEREEIKTVAKRLVDRQKLNYYANGWYSIGEIDKTEMPEWWRVREEEDFYYYEDENGNKVSTYGIEENKYNQLKKLYVKKQTIVDSLPQVWCYIFLDSKGYFFYKNAVYNELVLDKAVIDVDGGFNTPTAILCYPVDKTMYIRRNKDNKDSDIQIDQTGWDEFERKNPEESVSSHIKGIKLSLKPPIDIRNIAFYKFDLRNGSHDLDYGDNVIPLLPISEPELEMQIPLRVDRLSAVEANIKKGLFYLRREYSSGVPLRCKNNLCKFRFNKKEIVEGNKNKQYNPKLNNADYKSLNLTIAGSSFEMPLDKINNENPVFSYYESLTPEVTRGLLRLGYIGFENDVTNKFEEDVSNEIFNDSYRGSFNGFSYSNDFTIAFAKEAYAEYIANNKNAYLSFESQQNYNREIENISMVQKAINSISSALGGVATSSNPQTAKVNGQFSTATTAIDIVSNEMQFNKTQAYEKTQLDLSMDNMRNAPGTLSNINGSAILTQMIADFGIYAEIYEGLDNELETANDIMYRYGYTYNRFDNVKTKGDVAGVDYIRKRFNFVRAILGSIDGVAMSNIARVDLRNRFMTGIRFWNKNDDGKYIVDYTKENYELKL